MGEDLDEAVHGIAVGEDMENAENIDNKTFVLLIWEENDGISQFLIPNPGAEELEVLGRIQGLLVGSDALTPEQEAAFDLVFSAIAEEPVYCVEGVPKEWKQRWYPHIKELTSKPLVAPGIITTIYTSGIC